MVFQNYAFIGPDSLTAARAAEAAGKQNKLWNFIDDFYNNQGTENTDYVNDKFLTKIADGAAVDSKKMLSDRQDPKIDQAIALAQQKRRLREGADLRVRQAGRHPGRRPRARRVHRDPGVAVRAGRPGPPGRRRDRAVGLRLQRVSDLPRDLDDQGDLSVVRRQRGADDPA